MKSKKAKISFWSQHPKPTNQFMRSELNSESFITLHTTLFKWIFQRKFTNINFVIWNKICSKFIISLCTDETLDFLTTLIVENCPTSAIFYVLILKQLLKVNHLICSISPGYCMTGNLRNVQWNPKNLSVVLEKTFESKTGLHRVILFKKGTTFFRKTDQ